MRELDISSTEMTTILNVHITVSAISGKILLSIELLSLIKYLSILWHFVGFLNAPLFRQFTYRQVALASSFLTFLGLFLSAFATSFLHYIVAYSCIYGKLH